MSGATTPHRAAFLFPFPFPLGLPQTLSLSLSLSRRAPNVHIAVTLPPTWTRTWTTTGEATSFGCTSFNLKPMASKASPPPSKPRRELTSNIKHQTSNVDFGSIASSESPIGRYGSILWFPRSMHQQVQVQVQLHAQAQVQVQVQVQREVTDETKRHDTTRHVRITVALASAFTLVLASPASGRGRSLEPVPILGADRRTEGAHHQRRHWQVSPRPSLVFIIHTGTLKTHIQISSVRPSVAKNTRMSTSAGIH